MENHAQLKPTFWNVLQYRRGTSLYKATGSKPLGAAKSYLKNNIVVVFNTYIVCFACISFFKIDKTAVVSIIYEQPSYVYNIRFSVLILLNFVRLKTCKHLTSRLLF